jgi:broad specificity phosphatase PhoE
MSTLILVRHGQARTYEKESDQLSAVGEEQARALGRFWVRHAESFTEVYSGTLLRQRRTAEITGQSFIEAGIDWPRLEITPELNEYDSQGIINTLIPTLAEHDERFRELLINYQQNSESPERNRHFQRMFEAVTSVWFKGELEVEGVESWLSFSSRVRGVLKRILSAEASGRRVAIFTSGGPIGLTVQTALGAPEAKALEINWRVRNCSLSEFVFSPGRFSLDSFNAIPHLEALSLRTYR